MQTLQQLKNGELNGAVSLKLAEQLSVFPDEIFQLADTLETLDLSRNKLCALPNDFGRLHQLKILFCSENQFTVLPEVLADCPLLDIVGFKANQIETIPPRSVNSNLRWLILTDNRIKVLPAEIGECSRMEKLMLAGNQLQELPYQLSRCQNLALLRISANQLTQFPAWLLSMPKLAWLAFSGNLFSQAPAVRQLTQIPWPQLQINQLLGEGASGVISKAIWHNGTENKTVAVKVFKGAVTSDGLPEDEMNASIVAGVHPGLIKLVGQIAGHPDEKKGLVMELIPERFYNLGLPPSLASCSRDVFKQGFTLNIDQVVKIAATVASVGQHLHQLGIMHSDMYAHNTLIDNDGNTLFGDFGAACFYNVEDKMNAIALERLEVRAYGCLLDDLYNLCTEKTTSKFMLKLAELRNKCMVNDVSSRPSFQYLNMEIAKMLDA